MCQNKEYIMVTAIENSINVSKELTSKIMPRK